MEVKVSVDGVQRVVCGITEETTCQEVVVVLAQAIGMYVSTRHLLCHADQDAASSLPFSLGQPGRYALRETFKDFQRCMTPDEQLLESLRKYGEQAREVQLMLHHIGPLVWDEMSRSKVGRYQPCPPLRRKDAGTRMRRGSGSLSLHRRSLPPSLRQETEQQQKDSKKPKRKSLTLMEEAWEWLESLGKSKVYSTACDKDTKQRTEKRNRTSLDIYLSVDKDVSDRESRGKARGQRGLRSDLDHQTSCCMGSQSKGRETKQYQKTQPDPINAMCAEDKKNSLRETIMCQLSLLQDLQSQITHVDRQILELEEKHRVRRAEQETQQKTAEEEMEQIKFWENELKAEEGYEKDLQRQFLDLKAKALECKPKLEGYKRKLRGLDFVAAQMVARGESWEVSTCRANPTASGTPNASTEDTDCPQSDPDRGVNINRKLQPREEPHALVPPCQMKERRPTGPTELREWWTRWSEAQSNQSQNKKAIHRSELTIYLGNTKV